MDHTAPAHQREPERPRQAASSRHLTDRLFADVGLDASDGQVYRALLDLPEADAATLAWRLDTPPGAVAKQLRRLARRGFVTVDGEPARYRAVDPTMAVHLAVARRERSLLAELDRVGRVAAAVPALARSVADDRRHDDSATVVVLDPAGADQARADVVAAAATTLRCVVTNPGDDPPRPSDSVERRTLYRRVLVDDDTTYQQVNLDVLRGGDVRLLPDPGPGLLAADDHTALLQADGVLMLLTPSPLLDLVLRWFDQAWDRAMPLDGARADTAWAISEDDAALLRLLAAGLKDQAIARHLGIGLRTVVRRIGNLSRALDAETRFQAGLQASRRGLL